MKRGIKWNMRISGVERYIYKTSIWCTCLEKLIYMQFWTGTSDRNLICIVHRLRFSGFILYPLSFFLYSPFKWMNPCAKVKAYWLFTRISCLPRGREDVKYVSQFPKRTTAKRIKVLKLELYIALYTLLIKDFQVSRWYFYFNELSIKYSLKEPKHKYWSNG